MRSLRCRSGGWRKVSICAIAVATVGGAPEADAKPRRVAHAPDFAASPTIVGSELAWQDESCVLGCALSEASTTYRFRVMVARTGGRARSIATGLSTTSLGGSSSYEDVAFALSRTSLALRRQAHLGGSLSQDPPEDRRIRLGPRGGKLTTQLACQAVGDAHYALEGDRLLYLEGCDQRFQRLLLVDRATGRRSLVATLPPSLERGAATNVVEAVALAGELAAYTLLERGASPSRRTLFVYDTRAGGVLYRASISPDGSVDGLDLDARGRVVLLSAPLPTSGASRRPCGLVLSWYSPGEPFEHPLAVRVCDRPVRIVGEEIAFLGTSGSPLNRQIRFMTFDGRERVGVDAGRVPIVGYDADERRVAYALRACDGGADLMVNERSGLAFGSRSIRCPVELASRELVVRKGKALVRLWCPRGCTGLMRFRRGGRTISGDPEQFVQTARRGTHRIGVGRRLRRELRRHGRATARLRLVTDDRADRSWTPIEPRVSLRSAR